MIQRRLAPRQAPQDEPKPDPRQSSARVETGSHEVLRRGLSLDTTYIAGSHFSGSTSLGYTTHILRSQFPGSTCLGHTHPQRGAWVTPLENSPER